MEIHDLLDKYVEIPIHYDLWMRGARFGLVTGLRLNKYENYILVKMEHPQVKKLLKLWGRDFNYVKIIDRYPCSSKS